MPISILRKKDLSIVYMPLFSFSYGVIDSALPTGFFLLLLGCLVAYYVFYNLPFVFKNPFSIMLVIYFCILALDIQDFRSERKSFITVISLFLLIGVVAEVYKKYPRDVIFKELALSSFLILSIFVFNALFSTAFRFNPGAMYGISTGVLFGNIVFAAFNFLPLVCYVALQKAVNERNKWYFLIYAISVFLTLLTLRRSVMLLTLIGTLFVMIPLMDLKNIKRFFGIFLGLSLATLIVVSTTGFLEMIQERYELRQLEDRNLEEEGRVQEIGMVYRDLFVYFDYSPWFGYGLFDASGNYGKGFYGNRNLHTDLTVLIHGSGFLGLFLYLGMVGTVFWLVWKKTKTKNDAIQFVFICLVFTTYFITGRYNSITTTLLVYLILCLPIANKISEIPNNPTLVTE